MILLEDSNQELKFIVIGAECKGSARVGAEELARIIKKLTDKELPILLDIDLLSPAGGIIVGKTRFMDTLDLGDIKIQEEGYAIKTMDNCLVIWGDDEDGDPWDVQTRAGTLFGVVEFLEKVCKVSWIWPGESGEVFTRTYSILVPPLHIVDAPAVHIRGFTPSYFRWQDPKYKDEWKKWARRNKLGWIWSAYFGHSWETHLPPEKFREEHPEYYSLVSPENWVGPNKPSKSRRTGLKGDSWQICTSNLAVRKIIIESVLKDDKYNIVSISPKDGYQFCECEDCVSQDLPEEKVIMNSKEYPCLSERMWEYANFIAKRVRERDPEKGVGMFAYTFYSNPPKTIKKFEPNLYISHTMMAAHMSNDESMKWFNEVVDEWHSRGASMIARDYWGCWYFLNLPFVQVDEIGKLMPWLFNKGYIGFYGEVGKAFSTQLPNYHLLSKLMWNPNADPKRILNEFYERTYGPAASYMEKYWQALHDAWASNYSKMPYYDAKRSGCSFISLANSVGLFFTDDVFEECQGYLNQAKDLTDDKEILYRIEIANMGLRYTELLRDLLEAYRRLVSHGMELAFFTAHPEELDLSQKRKRHLLKKAFRLGKAREELLEEYHSTPFLDKALYEYASNNTERTWHQQIIEELNKDSAIL